MDIANSFPITAAYEDKDNFETVEDKGKDDPENEKPTKGGKLMGPGSYITVPPPLAGEVDIMGNVVKLISPDINTLDFHVGEDDRLRLKIFQTVVGSGGEPKNDVAKNEKQVMSSFESQTAALRRVAYNFEQIQKFADKCKIDIIYGVDSVTDITIDYGTKFFLKTVADLSEELAITTNDALKDSILNEINETKFKNDVRGLTRMKIIREIDPIPDKTIDEAILIYQQGGLSTRDFVIKTYLMNFIRRFEREQAPLVDFAQQKNYDLKIQSILEEIYKYADEKITEDQKPEP
jgi:hypothetical protein